MSLTKLVHSSQLTIHRIRKETVYKRRRRFGFTLVELLVVIFIISLLVTLGTITYNNSVQKSRDSKRKNDLQTIKQALETYFQQNNKYPDQGTIIYGRIKCNAGLDTTELAWGSAFICNSATYAALLPRDPKGTTSYYYTSSSPNLTYTLAAALENTGDPDYCDPIVTNCVTSRKLPCQPASPYNYCIVNP